jgi:hypothetical protein
LDPQPSGGKEFLDRVVFDVREFARLNKQGRLLLSVERSPGELIGAPTEVHEQSGRPNETQE